MNSTIQKKTGKMLARRIAAVTLAVMTTVVSVLPSQVNAASKNSVKDYLVSENNYANTMNTVVEPYINAYKQTGYITGEKNASLYYEKYITNNAKGTIVISHGFTESLEKYDEMIYYFLKKGYSVYGVEHRGHCRSGRLGIDTNQVNVESFSYYLKDIKTFLDQVVVPEAGKENLYLFGHSMGGGIAARFLEVYPGYFKAAALSSPMLQINSGDIPEFFAKVLAHGASITKWADDYVIGHGPFNADYDFDGSCTTSEPRYNWAWQTRVNNPELQMGGASYRWLSEAYYGTFFAVQKCNVEKINIPMIMFTAGNDNMVGKKGQDTFAKYAKDLEVIHYEDSKHELYGEKDDIVLDYTENLFRFFEEH